MTRPHRRLAREWVEQARHDFETAERELRFGGWPDVICFHAQQTLEKLLKAILVEHGRDITRFRWHDLLRLHDACLSCDQRVAPLRTACKQLTGYYIAARYPVGARYSRVDAHRAVAAARKAMKRVSQILSL